MNLAAWSSQLAGLRRDSAASSKLLAASSCLPHLAHALGEQLPPILVVDLLAKNLLRAIRGELPGELGQLLPRVLDAIVHFVPRGLQNLLRLGLGGGDHLALLPLAV